MVPVLRRWPFELELRLLREAPLFLESGKFWIPDMRQSATTVLSYGGNSSFCVVYTITERAAYGFWDKTSFYPMLLHEQVL